MTVTVGDVPVEKPSCATCPCLVGVNETQQQFRRKLDVPMCGKFGFILGLPKMRSETLVELWEKMPSECNSHGSARPPRPASMKTHLTSAAPEVMMMGAPDDYQKAQVSSCTMCANYVDPLTVVSKWGINEGLCGATGRVILQSRNVPEAKDCELRRPGRGDVNIETMLPLTRYKKLANILMNGGDSGLGSPESGLIEPREYETDKPVTEAENAAGIRAYRRVLNPQNPDKFVFLPIYHDSYFDAEELSKIPRTGDDEHPELYRDHGGVVFRVAMAWVGLDETPALWGEAGTGKTELFRYMAWLMNLPFERISITQSSEVDDLIGKFMYKQEVGTYWVYGRLPKAWRKPCVICLDEPNVGMPEVWQAIRPLTDNSKQMVVDQNEGERMPRHNDCYLGMAMNPAWDIRNIGAQQLADADGSRLGHIFMNLPPEHIEKDIIRRRCKLDGYSIPEKDLNAIMQIAKDIRKMADPDNGTLSISWGIRNQIKVARAFQFLDPIEAYRFAVIDSLEPGVGKIVLSTVKSVTA